MRAELIEKLKQQADGERAAGNTECANNIDAKIASLKPEPVAVLKPVPATFNFFANEIAVAAAKQDGGDVLVISSAVCKDGKDPEYVDQRWKNNPSRWDAPKLNLHTARAIRHEEIRLGRFLTPDEQKAHIRKLCGEAAAREREQN
jgi:hypothetical protein